jgi:O-antigen/teichoic acid export membrane protein
MSPRKPDSLTDTKAAPVAAEFDQGIATFGDGSIDPVSDQPRVGIRQMLMSASGTAVLQAFSNGAGLLTALLLARFLGRYGYGRYAIAFAWASLLAGLATLGLDRYLVRGIAVYEVHEQWQMMKGLLRRANQLVLLTSIIIAVSGVAIGLAWISPALRGPFCVAMLIVPVTALTLLRQGAMQAFGRVVSGQLPEYLIRPLLIIAGIIALKLIGSSALSPTAALGVNVAALAIACTLGAVLLLRALPASLHSILPRYDTREWLRGSVPMMLIGGVWMFNNYVGTLVTGTLRGPSVAGVYNVVQTGAAVIVLFLVAANMPLAPVVARLYTRGDREQMERTTEHIAVAGLLVSVPVCAALAIFPGVFLGIFGPGFRVGSTALTIVALSQLVNAAAGPAGNVLIMTGHQIAAVRAVGAGALVNLVLAVILVPPFGVTGGAIAFAVSLIAWNVALVVTARSLLGINVTAFRRLAAFTSI